MSAKLENRTLHVLRNRLDNSEKVFEWRNGSWGTPNNPYSTKESAMSVLGWSYLKPASPEPTQQEEKNIG